MRLQSIHRHIVFLILVAVAATAAAQTPGVGHMADLNGIEMYYEVVGDGDPQIRSHYTWVASLADSYNDMTFEPPLLATISAPTLVVHGDRDYCFPASMAWDIYEAIPDAAMWVVPNGSHVPISGSNAGRFADIALEFLE